MRGRQSFTLGSLPMAKQVPALSAIWIACELYTLYTVRLRRGSELRYSTVGV